MRSSVALLVAVLSAAGCVSNEPPTLESYEFWNGVPGAAGSQQVAVGPDGTLTLTIGKLYTGRAYIRTAGRGDRCIYRVFGHNWSPPSRQFTCTPESSKRLAVDESFGTWAGDLARTPEHSITISIAEYDVESRTELNRYTPVTIPVVVRP